MYRKLHVLYVSLYQIIIQNIVWTEYFLGKKILDKRKEFLNRLRYFIL